MILFSYCIKKYFKYVNPTINSTLKKKSIINTVANEIEK